MKTITRKIGTALATLVFIFTTSVGLTWKLQASEDFFDSLDALFDVWDVDEVHCKIDNGCEQKPDKPCSDATTSQEGFEKDKKYKHKCEETRYTGKDKNKKHLKYCQCQPYGSPVVPPPTTGPKKTPPAPVNPPGK